MRKIALFLLVSTSLFAKTILLENKTPYPFREKGAKIAVQWASSAREVQEFNEAFIQGVEPASSSLKYVGSKDTTKLSVPKNAEYFRVLIWPKGSHSPDLLTNWVEIVPDKTYQLNEDHLTPAVLMTGMGC